MAVPKFADAHAALHWLKVQDQRAVFYFGQTRDVRCATIAFVAKRWSFPVG